MLQAWKKKQEEIISNAGKIIQFTSFNELKLAVARLLSSNKMIFNSVGPLSSTANINPDSNAYLIWELRRIDRILPNNRKILNLIDANEQLIKDISIINLVEEFRLHVESYEKHIYHRLDTYPLFPKKIEEVFLNE